MCNNGITVNKGFVVSVTACQHIKFRNLTYVAIFVHNLLTESSTVIDNKQQKRKWESPVLHCKFTWQIELQRGC